VHGRTANPSTTNDEPLPFLRDPAFRQLLQDIRQTDNRTNWFYIARSWLILLIVFAGGVAGLEWVRVSEVGWAGAIVIVILSGLLVGAGQHHLGVLGHEGSHRTLFRNRWLNEQASDWLCMYPIFTTTYMYRLQHLAHHQFVNDPDRDPNVLQMRATDTWPSGPLRPRQLVLFLLRLVSPARLFAFLRRRARDNSFASDRDVYRTASPAPTWPKRLGAVCVFGQLGLNLWLLYRGDWSLLAFLPPAFWVLSMFVFALLPSSCYHRSRVKPDISLRVATLQRFTCYFLLFHGLAWLSVLTGRPAMWYWLVLWFLPLVTVFPLYVLLRQLLQHGNGDRGRLTNTRVFLRPWTVNFFLLPVGQDYHLPHHLFASIPHYRLRRLHQAMLAYSDYREAAIEVAGVIRSPQGTDRRSVVDVLGAEPARSADSTFIDSTVLDDCEVIERDAIRNEERASTALL
jgi:fatty acid desaturase